MRLLVALTIALVCANALPQSHYQDAFVGWMQTYQKSYSHEEFMNRFNIFRANLDFINEFNAQEGEHHTVGMNQFGDLTEEEFRTYYLGMNVEVPEQMQDTSIETGDFAEEKDWVKAGAVTGVKNQGQCGSCWAFSATGGAEGCHFLKTKSLVSLSEQNLMDCSSSYGNHGCNGGLMTNSFDYIIANKGIATEASYPYEMKVGQCRYDPKNLGATLTSYTNIKSGSEADLQAKLDTAPVSVALDAGQNSFRFYKSGVYYDAACSSTRLNHGVLATGWGVENGQAYWSVQNSWGTTWGNAGFIRMSRNRSNNCGIATMSTIPHC